MRPWISFTLVFLILLQWGLSMLSCLSLTQSIDEIYAMDAREAALAGRLQKGFALRQGVRIADGEEPGLRGAFYSNDPLFIEVAGSDTLRFQLLPEPTGIARASFDWLDIPLPFNQDPRQIALHSLFSKFFASPKVPGNVLEPHLTRSPFFTTDLTTVSIRDVPTPPPKDFLS